MAPAQDSFMSEKEEIATIADNTSTTPLLNTTFETNSHGTINYLAYGSNLCKATFRGARGINPLSSLVVLVPTLTLTFDLSGVPYSEPCFANSRYRDPSKPPPKSPYHKDRWQKGLIGVVYEVTVDDYRKIIASEGGGIGYQDVMVDCAVLPAGVASLQVGLEQDGKIITAHTLLAPPQTNMRWNHEFDPSYSQPSARYLGLITTGGEEHNLPADYMSYLRGIRPYRVTTFKQQVAKVTFAAVWWALLMMLFALGKVTSDKKGHMPAWLGNVMKASFKILWGVYDHLIKGVFGDGERTIGDSEVVLPVVENEKS